MTDIYSFYQSVEQIVTMSPSLTRAPNISIVERVFSIRPSRIYFKQVGDVGDIGDVFDLKRFSASPTVSPIVPDGDTPPRRAFALSSR